MTSLSTRPATAQDLPAVLLLVRSDEERWFGTAETDTSELAEEFARVADPTAASRVVLAGSEDGPGVGETDLIVAAGWVWGHGHTYLTARADLAGPAYDLLLPQLRTVGATEVEALAQDEVRHAALVRHGWERELSSYELLSPADAPPPASPEWPAGIAVTDFDPGQTGPAVHALIHRDAGWAEVPGHEDRTYDDWLALLEHEGFDPAQQVLAWRASRLAGAALGRTFSDGTGWVWQLAVAKDERGRGLGRALLLEALHRRLRAGARRVGLGVSAENPDALRLYLDVGLVVDREWVHHRPSGQPRDRARPAESLA